jgi:hypothetical protein
VPSMPFGRLGFVCQAMLRLSVLLTSQPLLWISHRLRP